MKLNNAVAVLDVGSSKVTAIIGEKAVNDNLAIRAIAEYPHEAFFDGQILEDLKDCKNKLSTAVQISLKNVKASARVEINEIFVGVPGEFLRAVNVSENIALNRKRKINDNDVEELYKVASSNLRVDGYTLIDKSAVYFNAGGSKVADAAGAVSNSLGGIMTFYFAKNDFVKLVNKIMTACGVKSVKFVPVPLAESLFLFSWEERSAYRVLVDVGYITTSFSMILGNGILYQGAFPVAGGHVASTLHDCLGVDYDVADRLKRKINLCIKPVSDLGIREIYRLFSGDGELDFDVGACNEIVCSVLDKIAEEIDLQFQKCPVKLPTNSNVSLSLTGGGVCFMRGAKEYLSKRLEMGVNVVMPSIPFMNKPDESSRLGVLNYALNAKKPRKKRFFF